MARRSSGPFGTIAGKNLPSIKYLQFEPAPVRQRE
jgi:hypothetical protein